jgi:hypothetical protein
MKPQHALTLTSNSGILRVLQSDCDVCAAFDPRQMQLGAPVPQFQRFKAIWDTGAMASVINDNVVQRCGLKPTGMVQVHGVHGSALAETFIVNMRLPNGVAFAGVHVTRGAVTGADALIGMDIITCGDFAITNLNGRTVCSYRLPSMLCIDFVNEFNEAAAREAKKGAGPGGFSGGKHSKGHRHGRGK